MCVCVCVSCSTGLPGNTIAEQFAFLMALIMKALKCRTLSACVAWQVMVSLQNAHDDSEVQLYSIL